MVKCAPGGCPDLPPDTDWVLADQLDVSRAAPGMLVNAKWDGLEEKDSAGRLGYLAGIRIRTNAVITVGVNNAAVDAYTLRGLIAAIILTDCGGHNYHENSDGRDVIDDWWTRNQRLPYVLDGNIGANVFPGVGGSVTVPIDIEFSLIRRTPDGNDFSRLLSIAAIKRRGAQAFQFRLAAAVAGSIPGAPVGLTLASFVRDDGVAGLDIKVKPVYADPRKGIIVCGPWAVRNYERTERKDSLDGPGSIHEYAKARYRIEDAPNGGVAGQQNAGGINNMTVKCGGNALVVGQLLSDLRVRELMLQQSFPDSAVALGLVNLAEPTDTGVTDPSRTLLPPRPLDYAPSGTVTYEWQQPAAFTRLLHSYTACDTAARAKKIQDAINCGPCSCKQLIQGEIVDGVRNEALPKILFPNQ